MRNFFRKLWDFLRDPRRIKPPLIAAPCLAVILAGLILLPHFQTRRSAETPAMSLQNMTVAAPTRSPALPPATGSAQWEGTRYEVIPDIETVTEVVDISQMSPDELPEEGSSAPGETVAEIILEPDHDSAAYSTGWLTVDGKEYFVNEDGSYAVGLKQIGGKLYYFNQYGVKASSVGIDVSFYNSDIDWQLVKAQGIDFAIIRIGGRGWTSGLLYDDCRTREYLRSARSAGILIGAYFYSTAINPYEAVEEASVAVKTLDGIPLDLPLFIDLEFSGEYPEGRSDLLSPSQRAEIATAFCETIRSSGYRPGVYAGQNFLKASIDYNVISRYTIWLASYTSDDQLPFFDHHYDLWQFTDWGRVDGIRGIVDMNVIF